MKGVWAEIIRRIMINWRGKVETWRRYQIERRRIKEEIGGRNVKSSFKRRIKPTTTATEVVVRRSRSTQTTVGAPNKRIRTREVKSIKDSWR